MPAPTTTVQERLIDAVIARLKAVVAGATYWFTVPDVRSGRMPDAWHDLAPFWHLGDIQEGQRHDPNPAITRQLRLSVTGAVRAEDTADDPSWRRRLGQRLLQDLETAVGVDDRWGELAEFTLLEESGILDDDEDPIVIVFQRMLIQYRTREWVPSQSQ